MITLRRLKKIVGSLLIVGFEGPELTPTCSNFLKKWNLGGVILFKRNIESFDQLVALNESIYASARLTPIVSVDHEGGRVFRLPEPFTSFPPMKRLGDKCQKDGNYDFAEEVGKAFGRELRAAGFNLDFAPVLDVDTNPKNPIIGDRAFSSDPDVVSKTGQRFLEGLQSSGVIGCAKHFPGHGSTSEDSHLTLPTVKRSLEELESCELKPFRDAVQKDLAMIMTAHVIYFSLDDWWPTTLSEKIILDLLRKQLGFQGLVVSDDLFMRGIYDRWELEEAAEGFLRVGGDMVLLCHEETLQERVAEHLVRVAERDNDFWRIIKEKSLRIKEFRKRLASGCEGESLEGLTEKHKRIAEALGG